MGRTLIHRLLALTCVTMLLLSGCHIGEEAPGITESQEWEVPQLNYGALEYEKLEVLPWYSGRTEATSFNMMAETEQGYYYSYYVNLWYADKTNLAGWYPVCNNPGCGHRTERCSAYLKYQHFVIKDNRIYTISNAVGLPDFYKGDARFLLMSMDPDGSNRKLAFAIEREDPSSTPRALMADVSPFGFFYNEYVLNTDGTHTQYLYWVREDGSETIYKTDTGEDYVYGYGGLNLGFYGLHGDRNMIVGEGYSGSFEGADLYRISKNDMIPLKLQAFFPDPQDLDGCYLSGDIIRCYRQNDGYYDINIQTGEEVKVADAQLQDAGAFVVLPNCILESTMAWENYEGQGVTPTEGEHKLLLFDGETWRSVELPEELRTADAAQSICVIAVTSDQIILGPYNIFNRSRTSYFYSIDLNKEDLKLEYAFELQS